MIIWYELGMYDDKILYGLLFKRHMHNFLNIKHFRDYQQINTTHNTIPAGEREISSSRDNLVT